jgi:hypothetical protein
MTESDYALLDLMRRQAEQQRLRDEGGDSERESAP